MKKITVVPGLVFKVISTGCIIELIDIKEKEKNKKLANPVYEFRYLNRDGNRANHYQDKPNFTTYLKEIYRAMLFRLWEPTINAP